MTVKMLVQTTESLRDANARTFISTSPKEVATFFKGNMATGGFTLNYAINPNTLSVVKIFKKGKIVQKDVKPLIEQGYDHWLYSWCFAGENFEIGGKIVPLDKVIDLTTLKDVAPWARAFGYL